MLFDSEEIRRAIMVHKGFWCVEHESRVLEQMVEECGELVQAVMKLKKLQRLKGVSKEKMQKSKTAIFNELMDVLCCADYWLESQPVGISDVEAAQRDISRFLSHSLIRKEVPGAGKNASRKRVSP